jgi:hypothetical protein
MAHSAKGWSNLSNVLSISSLGQSQTLFCEPTAIQDVGILPHFCRFNLLTILTTHSHLSIQGTLENDLKDWKNKGLEPPHSLLVQCTQSKRGAQRR